VEGFYLFGKLRLYRTQTEPGESPAQRRESETESETATDAMLNASWWAVGGGAWEVLWVVPGVVVTIIKALAETQN